MTINWSKLKKYISVFIIVSIYYFGITSTILVLSNKKSKAQDYPSNDYNLPLEWSGFKMVDSLNYSAEEKILIVSNRPYQPDNEDGELFPNDIAEFRKITYLIGVFNGNDWLIKPVKDLESGLDEINCGRDILLFVHGHGKSFITAMNRTYKIKHRYNVSLVVFDWPSQNSNFNRSLARVRHCGENYYNLLLGLEKYKNQHLTNDQDLSMMCHSLGNYFVSHMVVNGNNQYLNRKIFDNLILNSAAIRAKEHGMVISQIKMAEHIFVVSNFNDRVLRGANLLTTGKMLGNEILDPLSQNTLYFDFTQVAEKEHTFFAGYHKFEYTNPLFFKIYNSMFLGEVPDTSILKKSERKNVFIIEPKN